MNRSIQWQFDWDIALSMARVQEKYMLVEFSNPGCGACQQMEAVTYHDPRIIEFVNRSCIPLRVSTSSSSSLPAEFRIQYTPTIVLVDEDGKEHDRVVGFLRPEEFIPSVSLSIGKALFNKGQCDRAMGFFDAIVADYPRSQAAQPARDLKSACAAKAGTH